MVNEYQHFFLFPEWFKMPIYLFIYPPRGRLNYIHVFKYEGKNPHTLPHHHLYIYIHTKRKKVKQIVYVFGFRL